MRIHETRFYTNWEEYRFPDQGKDTWSCTKVKIHDRDQDDKIVYEYLRNYHDRGPFFPFKHKNGEWFALISEHYDRTQLIKLPSGESLGECNTDHGHSGFCPVHFYVPHAEEFVLKGGISSEQKIYYFDFEEDGPKSIEDEDCDKFIFASDIGFVAGCYWGNDTQWNIGCIDLTDIENGNFKINLLDEFMPHKINDLSLLIEPSFNNEDGKLYSATINGRHYKLKELLK
jgi:hypothetical protein